MTRRTPTLLLVCLLAAPAAGQPADADANANANANAPGVVLPDLGDRDTVGSVVKWLAVVTVVSIVPAIAVLVTSFTRIIVVFGLLRQGLATHQMPPNTVLFGLALLMSVVVMAPVFEQVQRGAIGPFAAGRIGQAEALAAAAPPLRSFMIGQIEAAGNHDDVYLFLNERLAAREHLVWRDVPSRALVPAFVVSELKVAFLIGFRIFLPFVIVDMLVASVLTSMGMLMLPPVLVSLPFKLLLFVLADGWHLVVGMLLRSFS
jgi:flagellar biosynthetic protein FliP